MLRQEGISVVISTNKGFIITVTKKAEIKMPARIDSLGVPPTTFTEETYTANKFEEALELVQFHLGLMYNKE